MKAKLERNMRIDNIAFLIARISEFGKQL